MPEPEMVGNPPETMDPAVFPTDTAAVNVELCNMHTRCPRTSSLPDRSGTVT